MKTFDEIVNEHFKAEFDEEGARKILADIKTSPLMIDKLGQMGASIFINNSITNISAIMEIIFGMGIQIGRKVEADSRSMSDKEIEELKAIYNSKLNEVEK